MDLQQPGSSGQANKSRLARILHPLTRRLPRIAHNTTLVFFGILLGIIIGLPLSVPSSLLQTKTEIKGEIGTAASIEVSPSSELQAYLEGKNSPLAPDAEFIVGLEHWRLVVAISAIESQFCKHQLYHNCWGIGGDSAYRHYESFRAAAVDTNDMIERFQNKGRWLTVEDMSGSYVVPASDNWVRVVNATLADLPQ